jgi:hypothetical protein
MLNLQPNYCNFFELNRQLILINEFAKKTEEFNFAAKEQQDINQFLPSVTDAKDIHRLIIRRMELLDIIEFHNKIPDNFPYTIQEMLEYIDYIEFCHKNIRSLI